LHISDLYEKPYRKLSFGERVKCEIASVLLHCPKYIILDEPTIGLDYIAKRNLYELLLFLNKHYNSTVIVVTHEVDYIEKICTRAIILSKGEVKYDGTPEKISKSLKHTISVKVKYESIRNEKLAYQIFSEADFVDKDNQVFVHHFFYADEKDVYIERITEAFSIMQISTEAASLREVFESVLKEVQGDKYNLL
jgi:ABC-2 type transport system ATP-binding protein